MGACGGPDAVDAAPSPAGAVLAASCPPAAFRFEASEGACVPRYTSEARVNAGTGGLTAPGAAVDVVSSGLDMVAADEKERRAHGCWVVPKRQVNATLPGSPRGPTGTNLALHFSWFPPPPIRTDWGIGKRHPVARVGALVDPSRCVPWRSTARGPPSVHPSAPSRDLQYVWLRRPGAAWARPLCHKSSPWSSWPLSCSPFPKGGGADELILADPSWGPSLDPTSLEPLAAAPLAGAVQTPSAGPGTGSATSPWSSGRSWPVPRDSFHSRKPVPQHANCVARTVTQCRSSREARQR